MLFDLGQGARGLSDRRRYGASLRRPRRGGRRGKEAELKSGRVDMLWNGLDITPKRKENILFSTFKGGSEPSPTERLIQEIR